MIRDRVKEICRKKKIQLSEISNLLNVSPPNLSYILNKKDIDKCTLQKIATILDVPISDLLSDVPIPDFNKLDIMLSNRKYSPVVLQIARICKFKGITQQELASRMNITYQSLHSLTKNPNLLSLERVAEALDVPLYCLFAMEDEEVCIPIRYKDVETGQMITKEVEVKIGFK